MTVRRRVGWVVLWMASLVGAGALGHAQTPRASEPAPTVVTGADLGFRIDGHKGATPIGTLVIRQNGQWVEAGFAMGVKRLTDQ